MGKLFGTDGARGVANTELTCELAIQIGRAAATVLTGHTHHKPRIVIGKDTRVSSDMLESALTAGLCSVGADAELLGVVPTPAVAYLVTKYKADAGVMISASHNPVEFNGIKLFSQTGYKLPDEVEAEIEALILEHPEQIALKTGAELGRVYHSENAVSDYVAHVKSTTDLDFSGICVAVDCANGSASATAERLFRELSADVHTINASPDGININDHCGSTHIEALEEYVKNHNCQLGVAFDGDADRCLAVDENGIRVDGDQIIALFAREMKTEGRLSQDTAVVTVMSNFGMQQFGRENGIQIVSTAVGDRYVLEEMLKNNYNLGGEDSGHIILREYANTGDGQLTAVQLLRFYKKAGKPLSVLAGAMEKSPQVTKSIHADAEARANFLKDSEILNVIEAVKIQLGENGRVLVRASGTEPLIRVMIEGRNNEEIQDCCDRICQTIEQRIS